MVNKFYSFISIALVSGGVLGYPLAQVQADETNFTVLKTMPVYQSGPYILTNTGIDVSNGVLDQIQGDNQSIVLKFEASKPNTLQAIFGISNSSSGYILTFL